jgi:RimJ/RimL family protein N-acetyltransferase
MDFGSPAPVSLFEGQVRVASIPVSDHFAFTSLLVKNKVLLDKFKVNVPDLKVLDTLGIYFDDVPVGQVTVWKFDFGSDDISLSYWVDEDFYRRGIAFASVKLVADFVVSKYDVSQVFIHVSEDNFASLQLAAKLGLASKYRKVFKTKAGDKLHYVFELGRRDNA